MLIVVDLEKSIYDQIMVDIEAGDYGGVQDYIKIALTNQLELGKSYRPSMQIPANNRAPRTQAAESKVAAGSLMNDKKDDLVRRDADFSSVVTFAMRKLSDGESIKSQWLWGQVNRLLGIKIALRVLANLQRNNAGEPISIISFLDECPRVAQGFGSLLDSADSARKIKRGDKLSTGLPLSDKGAARYKKQILFSERKRDGYYSSAIINLGFAEINKSGRTIALTKQGLGFSLLQNPVVDGEAASVVRTLSVEECEFYITHVRANIPHEWDAIMWVLMALKEGVDVPSKLDERLSNAMPEWTADMIVTQRSGAIGRSLDLGLLAKEKDGVNVTYRLSDFGQGVLKDLEQNS